MTSKEDVELICLSDSEEDEIEAEIEDAEDIKTIAPEHKPQPEMICLDDSESEEEDDDEDDVDEHLVNLDPKEKRTKLFVNYLPQNLTDAELNTIFMNCGPIKECKVFRDVATDYSFGYGIVDFEDPLDAARALKTKNQIQIQDKKLTVNYSRDGQHRGYAKLFFQNIGDESEVKIRGIFDKFGEILQFKILDNSKSGFVRYANRFQAMLAIRTLNNEHLFKGSDVKLIVKFAEEHGKQKSAIYAHLLKKAKRWNNHKPYHRYTRRFPTVNQSNA